jgi:tRNA (cmo5U34)-methyltransferase
VPLFDPATTSRSSSKRWTPSIRSVTDSPVWNEDDSATYRQLAPVAVPSRVRQLATIATLLPFDSTDTCRIVEIGCGEGILGHTLAELFPNARITELDGSPTMREATAHRLALHGDRIRVDSMDLASDDWHVHLDGADAVVSSLVIHHLDGPGKKRLFEDIGRRSSERSALVVADLVEPAGPQALELFAGSWDESARLQAEGSGRGELFDLFRSTEWNIYRVPDPMDKPSRLVDQLQWLADAGFALVDCFWLEAGHAIYGGYKQGAGTGSIDYTFALGAASKAAS